MANGKIPEKPEKTLSYTERYRLRNQGRFPPNNSKKSFSNAIKEDIEKSEDAVKKEFKSLEEEGKKAFQ